MVKDKEETLRNTNKPVNTSSTCTSHARGINSGEVVTNRWPLSRGRELGGPITARWHPGTTVGLDHNRYYYMGGGKGRRRQPRTDLGRCGHHSRGHKWSVHEDRGGVRWGCTRGQMEWGCGVYSTQGHWRSGGGDVQCTRTQLEGGGGHT